MVDRKRKSEITKYRNTYDGIIAALKKNPLDITAAQDMIDLCKMMLLETGKGCGLIFDKAHEFNRSQSYRNALIFGVQKSVEKHDFDMAERFNDALFRSYCLSAQVYFEDYLLAVEFGKPLAKQFYRPRQRYLKKYVDAYQKIADGQLDFLSISMPKRCGKSQTGINFVNFMSGRKPNNSTLMEGTGDDLVKSFYSGCLEYLETPSEYHFYDIFPESKLVQTNADTKIINLDIKSRFPTIMCRSIDARQVGLSEATNLLYLDDCVEGREEAKNRPRLDAKWEVISGDILGRAIEGTPIVICGTRYSLYDPIGRMQEEMKKQSKRIEIIETPALDPDTDESNFEHERDGVKVFTTQYFRNQREMLNAEQWESEFQQQPFEAKGLLFPKDSLNYFFELPADVDPDTVFAVCDTAEKGSDYCSMPVAKVYGDEIYIVDVVFDDSAPEITKPECAKKLIENGVTSVTFESNNAGSYFARDVEKIMRDAGYICGVRTKRTLSNKETRIEFASDVIIKKFYFLHESRYKKYSQYAAFMKQIWTYTRSGKVEHDDGPDSLSLMENELRSRIGVRPEIVNRLW